MYHRSLLQKDLKHLQCKLVWWNILQNPGRIYTDNQLLLQNARTKVWKLLPTICYFCTLQLATYSLKTFLCTQIKLILVWRLYILLWLVRQCNIMFLPQILDAKSPEVSSCRGNVGPKCLTSMYYINGMMISKKSIIISIVCGCIHQFLYVYQLSRFTHSMIGQWIYLHVHFINVRLGNLYIRWSNYAGVLYRKLLWFNYMSGILRAAYSLQLGLGKQLHQDHQ